MNNDDYLIPPEAYNNNSSKGDFSSQLTAFNGNGVHDNHQPLPEILFVSSYPPRLCGIATFTQDLMNAINEKFGQSFSLKVCALESDETTTRLEYPAEVKYILRVDEWEKYDYLASKLNLDKNLKLVFVQHEFGLYGCEYGEQVLRLLSMLEKPVITTMHTVLPHPDAKRKKVINEIVRYSKAITVMTKHSANILVREYGVPRDKVAIIPHGTHLISAFVQQEKKAKKQLSDRIVLSTFGLLSSGKNIELALDAMPAIIEQFPNVMYLIIGATHPTVKLQEGESYRDALIEKIASLNLQNNVRFINKYLPLQELLDYLQLTDIYLFTSKNPHQAVSGTFAYAMGCGCPVISTPIPHAKEMMDGAGIIVPFQNAKQLAKAAIKMLADPKLLREMQLNALHRIHPTAWPNSAVTHVRLIQNCISHLPAELQYSPGKITMQHVKRLTTNRGMIQFAIISTPDLSSGYTLDDNARALIALSRHYTIFDDTDDLILIQIYLEFILSCQQPDGKFLNYVDKNGVFMPENYEENLEDANGRAIWGLGEFIAMGNILDKKMVESAINGVEKSFEVILGLKSPRAIAFAIKGLFHYGTVVNHPRTNDIITQLADNLISKYRGVSVENWQWYEPYLTYANAALPEAMLYASLATGSTLFRSTAKDTFDFLLSVIFKDEKFNVVSNQGWKQKGQEAKRYGEQPIDVTYTILALDLFYEVFDEKHYHDKMKKAFNWFLGENHLGQIVYNPVTGGCFDGLEKDHVNLNQGAESTLSYLMARLVMEKHNMPNHRILQKASDHINQYELV